MLKLSVDEQNIIANFQGKIITLNGVKYYVKKCFKDKPYLELVAQKVLEILDINHLQYEAIKIDGNIYYLSPVCGKDYFLTGNDMCAHEDTLWDVWHVLKDMINDEQRLMFAMNTMVKKYLFDIMFLNSDGANRNWALISDYGVESVVVYDNEFIFDDYPAVMSARIDEEEMLDEYYEPNVELYFYERKNLNDLEHFLNDWGVSYRNVLESMMALVTPEVLENIISDVEYEVEEKLPKKEWLNLYKHNYECIKDLLDNAKEKNIKRMS